MNNGDIRKCLSCKFARNILRCYWILKREVPSPTPTTLQGEAAECLATLSDFWGIGDIPDNKKLTEVCRIFKNSDNSTLYQQTEYEICIQMLTTIIYEMSCFFNRENVFSYRTFTASIFAMMHDSLAAQNEASKKSLPLGKYARKFAHLDEKVDDSEVTNPERRPNLKTIAESTAITKKEYAIVEHAYLEAFDGFINSTPEQWLIPNRYDCMWKDIFALHEKGQSLQQRYQLFIDRRDSLDTYGQAVVDRFIMKLPTDFGHNLAKVMAVKGMGENTIVHLIKPLQENANSSDIQGLKNRKTIVEDPAFIRLLCRVLLVDRDVLYSGTGKSYGNWMKYLADADAAREGLEKLMGEGKADGKTDAKVKAAFRDALAKLLSQDLEVEQLIQKQAGNFNFTEEEFSVFKEIDANGIEDEYEDPVEHYQYILDTTPLDILLGVLAGMEK